jgi:uncharacterized protein
MKISRRKFMQIAGGTAIGAVATGATYEYARKIEPNHLVLERKTVAIPTLPESLEGFRIVLLSDFHLGPYTQMSLINRSIEMANSLKPDLILLGGDFVYAHVDPIFEIAPALTRLNAKQGVFSVLGNHDHYNGPETIVQSLRAASIPVLMNEGVTLGSLYLAGIDSVWAGQPDPRAAFAKRSNEPTTLVLVHEPDYVDQLVHQTNLDLQISGHTHGGQIRLPLIGQIYFPEWGEVYSAGLYKVRQSQLYVSRGIGVIGLPFRFDCPPEVTEITLRSGVSFGKA